MKRIIIANGIPIAYHITGKDYINYLNDAKKKKNGTTFLISDYEFRSPYDNKRITADVYEYNTPKIVTVVLPATINSKISSIRTVRAIMLLVDSDTGLEYVITTSNKIYKKYQFAYKEYTYAVNWYNPYIKDRTIIEYNNIKSNTDTTPSLSGDFLTPINKNWSSIGIDISTGTPMAFDASKNKWVIAFEEYHSYSQNNQSNSIPNFEQNKIKENQKYYKEELENSLKNSMQESKNELDNTIKAVKETEEFLKERNDPVFKSGSVNNILEEKNYVIPIKNIYSNMAKWIYALDSIDPRINHLVHGSFIPEILDKFYEQMLTDVRIVSSGSCIPFKNGQIFYYFNFTKTQLTGYLSTMIYKNTRIKKLFERLNLSYNEMKAGISVDDPNREKVTFSSRYDSPKWEDDFIDLDALINNVVRDTIREAEEAE